MRPSHWTKNAFVFAALIFGRQLSGPPDKIAVAVGSAVAGFFCFCLAASANYILNDIIDRDMDRMHPKKSSRPIAAGTLSVGWAAVLAAVCAAVSLGCSFILVRELAYIIAIYMVLMLLYSLFLKKAMILDVIVISIGFVLRAVAGAVVVGVFISPWLIICTFALCLFLGFSKRRGEVAMLAGQGQSYRQTLAGYNVELLGHMLDVTSGLAIVSFLLYAMAPRTFETFGTQNLVFTTPLVMYCIFRFSLQSQSGRFQGPVEIILTDRPFQIGAALWLIACLGVVYGVRIFGFSGIIAY
jgi:4-hydroxybenzoate polyprenyltransferase